MSTAYAATAQAWAASQKTPSHEKHPRRRPSEAKASSWRPPVAVFVKMEFGISFGGVNPNKPHKVALGYPPTSSKRPPRSLLASGHAGAGPRAVSADARPKKPRAAPIPRAIAPAHTISLQRKPVPQPPSSVHPHESASQMQNERPSPRRSSSLNVPHESRIAIIQQPPHPERAVKPRSPPSERKLSARAIEQNKPLPEIPFSLKRGGNGMSWGGPDAPFVADAASPGQCQCALRSSRAISSPSDMEQRFDEAYRQRSVSSPNTPIVSPIVSPLTSHASTRRGEGHNRMSSWGVASAGGLSPIPTSATSRTSLTVKGITNPPPLQSAPPNMPLPPVPPSPRSQDERLYHEPVVKRLLGHEETEDEAIKRELQEAKDARRRLTTDPQRARELGELNAAMVGFEALDDRFYEPLSPRDASNGLASLPRSNQSLGWAVRVEPDRTEQTDAERRAARSARKEARRKAKGKEPMRDQPRVRDGRNGNESGNAAVSRPSMSGSEGVRQRGAPNSSAREYYTTNDVGASPENAFEEYTPEEWGNGDGEGSIWRGMDRRRSWTSGEALEWEGQYWSLVNYR